MVLGDRYGKQTNVIDLTCRFSFSFPFFSARALAEKKMPKTTCFEMPLEIVRALNCHNLKLKRNNWIN